MKFSEKMLLVLAWLFTVLLKLTPPVPLVIVVAAARVTAPV